MFMGLSNTIPSHLSLDGKTEQYYNKLNNKSDKKCECCRRELAGVGCSFVFCIEKEWPYD